MDGLIITKTRSLHVKKKEFDMEVDSQKDSDSIKKEELLNLLGKATDIAKKF